MLPIRTERLTIRHLRATDMPVVAAYRNDPEVARFQDWALPYDQQAAIERFEARAAEGDDLGRGTNLAIEEDGSLVGDLYVRAHEGIAEVGWTLARSAQGRGLAVAQFLIARGQVQERSRPRLARRRRNGGLRASHSDDQTGSWRPGRLRWCDFGVRPEPAPFAPSVPADRNQGMMVRRKSPRILISARESRAMTPGRFAARSARAHAQASAQLPPGLPGRRS